MNEVTLKEADRQTARIQARENRQRRKRIQREYRGQRKALGQQSRSHTTRPNRTSSYKSIEQEQQARTEAVISHTQVLRRQLPVVLAELAKIPDPRNPKMIKHKLVCLFIYGILMFVLHSGSRRKTNEKLTAAGMFENLKSLFPDLETIPHQVTLYRFLVRIDVERIEQAQLQLIRSLIEDKKLAAYRMRGNYVIAIDGTQKLVSNQLVSEQWLQREVGSEQNKRMQYHVNVLEANLVLSNGMTIPVMSEFLDYSQGDSAAQKQDCEQRGFFRLAQRLKKAFPRLPILLVLDGLFPTGPVMQRCKHYHWHFAIVLKDESLEYVWQEYYGLRKLQGQECRLQQQYNDREQSFEWVNDIDYRYGSSQQNSLIVHLIVCEESWWEVDQNAELVQRHKRFAWISDEPFAKEQVHQRCNLEARPRWGIEESFLVEKHHGYSYEHLYAENWNAIRGYHYLMRIGHLLNVLAQLCVNLVEVFREKGPQGFIEFVTTTLQGMWLDHAKLRRRLAKPFQLRLIYQARPSPVIL